MIPKTIHYCWFGGNPLPKLAKKCVKSWKKYCPDYEIIRWDESNYDISAAPLYVRQAYEAKKWAFVTDYVRLWAIAQYGGIYMDTDVELVKPLDDFLKHNCFMGFQHEHYVNTGLIVGAEKGHAFILENAAVYQQAVFTNHVDSNQFTVCQEYTTDLLRKRGLIVPCMGEVQKLGDIMIFPPEFFCPYDHRYGTMNKTGNTTAIHHFASSWWDEERKTQFRRLERIRISHEIIHLPNKLVRRIIGVDRYEKLKNIVKKRYTP